MAATKNAPPIHPAIDFSAGVLAGVAGVIVGQPFDVIKVRYQTPSFAGRYTSTFGAFSAIVREEKVRGLFKGVLSPIAGVAFINGLVFTSYTRLLRLQHPGEYGEPSLGQMFLAGAGAGAITSLFTCPTELVKIRQISAPTHLNPTTLDICRTILRRDGLRGLYRGLTCTALRDLAFGPYFFTYEGMCRFFKYLKHTPEDHSFEHNRTLIEQAENELSSGLSWGEFMTAGGCAGVVAWIVGSVSSPIAPCLRYLPTCCAATGSSSSSWRDDRHDSDRRLVLMASWVMIAVSLDSIILLRLARSHPIIVIAPGSADPQSLPTHASRRRVRSADASQATFPLDVIKTRIQSEDPRKESRILRTAHEAIRESGWKGLFAGLGPTLIRAVPTNMVIFLTFELTVSALKEQTGLR